jgi:hypothetical protein
MLICCLPYSPFFSTSFHHSTIPIAKMLFSFQPPDQRVHLGGKIGNHDDQKD